MSMTECKRSCSIKKRADSLKGNIMSIKLEGIHYLYGRGTEMVVHALKDINIEKKVV